MGLTFDQVAINWLLLGWLTVCGLVNRLNILTKTKVNSVCHSFGVDKLSAVSDCLAGVKSEVSLTSRQDKGPVAPTNFKYVLS